MFFLKFLHTSSNLTVSDSIETNLYNQQTHWGCCKWVERQITIAFRWVNPLCSMVLATSRCQRRWLLWPRCLTMVTCGNWSTQHPESKHWQSEIELVHCEISGELHTLNSTTGRVILWVVGSSKGTSRYQSLLQPWNVALYTHKSSNHSKSHEWSFWSSWSVSVTYVKVFCTMSSLGKKGIIQAYKQFLGHRFSWKHDAIISSENSWNLGSQWIPWIARIRDLRCLTHLAGYCKTEYKHFTCIIIL